MLLGTLAAFSNSNDMGHLRPPKIGRWTPAYVGATYPSKWPELTRVEVESLPQTSALINKWVNANIDYVRDSDDEWKSPAQTLEDGFGDCEDFAILKHQLLAQAGLYSWVLIGYDKIQRRDHAYCITLFDVLDVTNRSSVKIKQLIEFTPQIAINGEGTWLYGD